MVNKDVYISGNQPIKFCTNLALKFTCIQYFCMFYCCRNSQSCPADRVAMLCCSSPTACHPAAGTNLATEFFQSLIIALVLSRLDYCNSVLFGLPANLIQHLQSAQNAAARLIFRIRRSEHITAALITLHWLRVPERTAFKLAVLTYRSIHGTLRDYLQSCFTRVADITSRRQLRSSTSDRLDVSAVRLSTVGMRAFPVSGANIWNDLPTHTTSAQSLEVFRQLLKTFLFTRSYPNIFI